MRAPLPFLGSALLWTLLVSADAATIDLIYGKPAEDTCKDDIASSSLSPRFFISIAHAVHSITVEDLQFYFNANANETNNIPTVNQDLLSDDAILNHAPKTGSKFNSQAMKTMDLVLSNMDEKMWGAKNYNTLERILHAFHMQEMWSEAAVVYKEMLKSPPSEASLCSCLKDVENNGVFHQLRMIGLSSREPELMYNADKRLKLETDGQQERVGRSEKLKSVYPFKQEQEQEQEQERVGRSNKLKSVYSFKQEQEQEQEQERVGRSKKLKSVYSLTETETDDQQERIGRSYKLTPREERKLLETKNEDVNIVDEASWKIGKTEFLKPRHKMMPYEQALYFYCMLEL